ncbi:unnamed protein product [marine sediment metagenome]|uniref:Uncharacterized protein n=1 Tax=marine sediment metagenome TaxID=412755 RepID=X1GDE8_9ZZZZ
MIIISFVELTPAQKRVLEGLQNVTVRVALINPYVVATVRTFQQQEVKLTLDPNGVIEHV